jgi:hypothetical protein
MGANLVQSARAAGARVLAIAHRRELVGQLLGHFGSEAAAICPGFDRKPDAPIQVATVQSLLATGLRPEAEMILWDECHHVPSDEWRTVLEPYNGTRTVGLTATPSRSDGRALGDMFQEMVVAADYSTLIKQGRLVPCRVFQAQAVMGSNELALDPVEAIKRHAKGQMFVFCKNIDHAYEVAIGLNDNQISAAVIEHNTPPQIRADEISRFRRNYLDALCNVFTLVEGVDCPEAKTAVICRPITFPGTYIQMVGRVLRAGDKGKTEAILIDLSGASLLHGLPTEDREYSLCGKPIGRKSEQGVRVCMSCGYTYLSVPGPCPNCGFVMAEPKEKIKVYSSALREVYEGVDTPTTAKVEELQRLLNIIDSKGWGLSWALKQYKNLFMEKAPVWRIPLETRKKWYHELGLEGKKRGYKSTYPTARYHGELGCWPEWSRR